MNFRTSALLQLQDLVPGTWSQDMGAQIWDRYWRLRTRMLGARTGTFGDKHRMSYALVESGRPQRLVYLHGFADCKENFFDCAHFLKNDYDLLIPDLPGFGQSFCDPDEDYRLAAYGKWLGELFDELGWDSFHLVGNSLGGACAIQLALTRPEMIQSLTLIDPAGIVQPELSSIYHEFLNDRVVFEIHSPLQFQYFLERTFQKPPIIPPIVYSHVYESFAQRSSWNRKILSDLLEGITSMSDRRLPQVTLNRSLKRIKAPTLILWGEKDSFFPVASGRLAQSLIKGSQLHVLAGMGHAPQMEAPWKITSLIRGFIKSRSFD